MFPIETKYPYRRKAMFALAGGYVHALETVPHVVGISCVQGKSKIIINRLTNKRAFDKYLMGFHVLGGVKEALFKTSTHEPACRFNVYTENQLRR